MNQMNIINIFSKCMIKIWIQLFKRTNHFVSQISKPFAVTIFGFCWNLIVLQTWQSGDAFFVLAPPWWVFFSVESRRTNAKILFLLGNFQELIQAVGEMLEKRAAFLRLSANPVPQWLVQMSVELECYQPVNCKLNLQFTVLSNGPPAAYGF